MSPITTHVLDTALGRPARGVAIELHYLDSAGWREMGHGTTDADGRLKDLVPPGFPLPAGVYRLTFGTGAYHVATGQP